MKVMTGNTDTPSRGIYFSRNDIPRKTNQLRIGRTLQFALVFAGLLPYFKTSPMATDNQPQFHIILLLFCITYSLNYRRLIGSGKSWIVAVIGALGLWTAGASVTSAIALGLLPVTVAAFRIIDRAIILSAAKAALCVYWFGILIQVVTPGLIEIMVSNSRVGSERGFTSFTSEPSYLAYVAFAIMIIMLDSKARWYWVFMSVLLAVASQSAAGLVPMAIVLASGYFSPRKFIQGVIALAALFAALLLRAPGGRLDRLIDQFGANPFEVFKDESIAIRISESFGPIVVAYWDAFVPHAYPIGNEIPNPFWYLNSKVALYNHDPSTLLTVLIFILGFPSFPLLAWVILKTYRNLPVCLGLSILSLANIAAGTPYLALIISLGFPIKKPAVQLRSTENPNPQSAWLIRPK